MTSWLLNLPGEVLMLNRERNLNRYGRADVVRQWRNDTRLQARHQGLPTGLDRITVTSRLTRTNRKSLPDIAAEIPTTKAAIDGLVDHGIIPDDTPAHLVSLTFLAPLIDPTQPSGLLLEVTAA